MESTKLYNSPNVANKIKETAKAKGKILKDLLQQCNLGSNTFSHMLHGKAIAYDSLANIADYLDCSVDFLLGRTNNTNAHKSNAEIKGLPEEQRLITAFRQLTEEGKMRVLDEAEMCANTPKFQKYTDVPKEA